jgi:hypothetical protein
VSIKSWFGVPVFLVGLWAAPGPLRERDLPRAVDGYPYEGIKAVALDIAAVGRDALDRMPDEHR